MLSLLQPPVVGEHQANKIIEGGMTNPITMFLLVVALILIVAAAVWAIVILPAQRRTRREWAEQERADKQQEQEFRLKELSDKRAIEEARAAQTTSIHATTVTLAGMQSDARAILELSQRHLDRNCPGKAPSANTGSMT